MMHGPPEPAVYILYIQRAAPVARGESTGFFFNSENQRSLKVGFNYMEDIGHTATLVVV